MGVEDAAAELIAQDVGAMELFLIGDWAGQGQEMSYSTADGLTYTMDAPQDEGTFVFLPGGLLSEYDGVRPTNKMFTIRILDQDRIEVFCHIDSATYTLTRL